MGQNSEPNSTTLRPVSGMGVGLWAMDGEVGSGAGVGVRTSCVGLAAGSCPHASAVDTRATMSTYLIVIPGFLG